MAAIIKTDEKPEVEKASTLDFDSIVDTRTAIEELVILDGKGQPTPLKIKLMSLDSDAWRRKQYDTQIENARYAKEDSNVPFDKISGDAIEQLVTVTVGWEGITRNDCPMPCTPENVRLLYQKAPYIADQVWAFVRRRENFMQN